MDLGTLFVGYAALKPEDENTKATALRFAHSLTPGDVNIQKFVSDLPEQITKFRYGTPADDAYFTSILASLSRNDPTLDFYLISIFNKIALQLTFQTRFIASGHAAEAIVMDGNKDMLAFSLINANGVAGIGINDEAATIPEWGSTYPHIKIENYNVLSSEMSGLTDMLDGLARPVGSVITNLPARTGDLSLKKRYALIEPYVSRFTSYVFAGPESLVAKIKTDIESLYPNARVLYNAYHHIEQKAVCFVEECESIPDVSIGSPGSTPCQFKLVQDIQRGLQFIEYAPSEPVVAKAPLGITSTAPLTEENISKINFKADLNFHAIVIRNGTVIPAVNTFLYKTEFDDLLFDMADNSESFRSTTIYRNGETRNGVRHVALESGPTMSIDSAAMPLFFTPNLHEWFSHFLIQCFPRIKVLRDLGVNAKILVPTALRKKQRAMLHMAGVSESDIVEVPDGVRVRAAELIVPRVWPLMFSEYTASIYDELLWKVVHSPPKIPSKRILISRNSRQTWRNMLTYDAIKYLLTSDFDFEEIFPERLSLEEEINLFNNADIIAGAEGAGLYGACYAQSRAKALVIADEDYVMPILATLATCRGFEISYVFGESFRSDLDVKRRLGFGHANFVVDPVEVAKMVKMIS